LIPRRGGEIGGCPRRELLFDNHVALDAVRAQRVLDDRAKEHALARVGANVRVAYLRWVDDAADDERGASVRAGPFGAAGFLDQCVHRLLRALFHDLHAARDFGGVAFFLEEPVVVRLTGFGRAGIAEIDAPAGDRDWRLDDSEALQRRSPGRKRVLSPHQLVHFGKRRRWSRTFERAVPLQLRAMSRTSASVARIAGTADAPHRCPAPGSAACLLQR
jgi:hypothetical protein